MTDPPATPKCEGDLAFNFDKNRLNMEGCAACLEHQMDWKSAQKRLLNLGYSKYRIDEGCPEPCGLELELHHDAIASYHALIAAITAENGRLRAALKRRVRSHKLGQPYKWDLEEGALLASEVKP